MSALHEELKLIVSSLDGASKGRAVCPACHGGSTGERSLSVARVGPRYTFHCYRATCSLNFATLLGDGTISTGPDTSHTKKGIGWSAPTEPLPDLLEEWLGEYASKMVRMTPDCRLVIPIYDAVGRRRGDVVRQLKPYQKKVPKSLTLQEDGYCGLAWFRPTLSTPYTGGESPPKDFPICVVEDPLSAMRLAANGVIGVALLGAAITDDKASELRKICGSVPVHLCLDADAYKFSVKQVRKLYNSLDLRVHRLYHDVKDMGEKEFLNFLQSLVV